MPSTKLITLSLMPAEKKIAKILGVEQGEKVICVKRLRLVDGFAAIFEADYFPKSYDFLMHADLENTSIFELFRQKIGMIPKGFSDVFGIAYADKEQAVYLDCTVGTPLLQVSQTVISPDLSVLYFNEQYIRADRYKYTVRSY